MALTITRQSIPVPLTMARGGTEATNPAGARAKLELGDLALLTAPGGATTFLRADKTWAVPAGGGGGAPTDAEYITSITNATLSAERVLTDTASVTWDRTVAGQIKANAVGSGSGDVSSNTATSVDNELAVFSGTTGKLLKRGTGSGLAWIINGALGVKTPVPTGALVGTTDAQTLTSKTITGASNTLSIREADLVLTDVTTRDVSLAQHGFIPKAPGGTTLFFRGDATWAVPAGGGGGAPTDAEYITSVANASLSLERVLTDTATITWDRTTAGQIKANVLSTTEETWLFSTSVTMADPGSGRFRTNQTAFAASTQLVIHDVAQTNVDMSNILKTVRVDDLIALQDKANAANWGRYRVTGTPTDNATWWLIDVAWVEGGGVVPTNNTPVLVRFTEVGGAAGGGGGGAPTDAEYITSTPHAALSAERVLTDTATITWDRTTAGEIKANAIGGGGGGDTIWSRTALGISSLATGCLAWWHLEEATGNRLDSIGTNHLVPTGSTSEVSSGAGKHGMALAMNGTPGTYLSVADNATLSAGPNVSFTVSCWVYVTNAGANHGFVGKGSIAVSTNNAEYLLWQYAGNWRLEVGNGSQFITTFSSFAPVANQWCLLIGWYDAVADMQYLQVNNGTPVSTANTVGSYDSALPFEVGRTVGFASQSLDGRVDSVGFWKRVLTPAERDLLWNNGAGLPQPFEVPSQITPAAPADQLVLAGVATTQERLEVDGGIKVGNSTGAVDGILRWTGTDLEVRKGGAWVSLTT